MKIVFEEIIWQDFFAKQPLLPKILLRDINGLFRTLRHNLLEWRGKRLSKWDSYHLLAYCAFLTTISKIPILGYIMRKLRLVLYNPLMPDFKSTWCCTYDCFGSHFYQHYIEKNKFIELSRNVGNFEEEYISNSDSAVRLKKVK